MFVGLVEGLEDGKAEGDGVGVEDVFEQFVAPVELAVGQFAHAPTPTSEL